MPQVMRCLGFGAALFFCSVAGSAQADLLRLERDSVAAREALRAQMVEALVGLPELLPEDGLAPPAPVAIYAEEAQSDLALIAAWADRLFAPTLPGFGAENAAQVVALITGANCAECAQAEADLRALSERYDLRVTLIERREAADVMRALELDLIPSYVFRDQMIRGAMPKIVLERYISE